MSIETTPCSVCGEERALSGLEREAFERGRQAGLEEAARLAYGYVGELVNLMQGLKLANGIRALASKPSSLVCVPREKLEAVRRLAMYGGSEFDEIRAALDAILAEGK